MSFVDEFEEAIADTRLLRASINHDTRIRLDLLSFEECEVFERSYLSNGWSMARVLTPKSLSYCMLQRFMRQTLALQRLGELLQQLDAYEDPTKTQGDGRSVRGAEVIQDFFADAGLSEGKQEEADILTTITGVLHKTRWLEDARSDLGKSKSASPEYFAVVRELVRDECTERRVLAQFMKSREYQLLVRLEEYASRPVTLDAFETFRTLGTGAYAAVSAVHKGDTASLYACKTMDKAFLCSKKVMDQVLLERQILQQSQSPFVLSLKYAFETKDQVHMVIDMCTGGDLAYHLRYGHCKEKKHFDLDAARFYTAEILCGLEHLHGLGYIFRDLKPNNVLLGKDGHAVLSDLGLCCDAGEDIRRAAGTRGYWAPEVVSRSATLPCSDLFSLGVLLYELVAGTLPKCTCDVQAGEWCPFGSGKRHYANAKRDTQESLFEQFNSSSSQTVDYKYLNMPDMGKLLLKCDHLLQLEFEPVKHLAGLVGALTTVDPAQRLGSACCQRESKSRQGSAIDEVKAHAFFATLDWAALARKENRVPFIPDDKKVNARDMNSVGTVPKLSSEELRLFHDTHPQAKAEMARAFKGFSYVSRRCVCAELVRAVEKVGIERLMEDANTTASTGCCAVQ